MNMSPTLAQFFVSSQLHGVIQNPDDNPDDKL